jgi:hypothetical protein
MTMSSDPGVYARLDRIKALWRELERTRRTLPRYAELIEEIRAESLAYQALLTAQDELDRRQTRDDPDRGQTDAERRQADRREADRRQTDRRKK